MALCRNMNKTPRVMETLKQMKSRFLSTPDAQMPVCGKIKVGIINYAGNKPLHRICILRIQWQPTLHTCSSLNYCSTASFHHLAENALIAWAMSKKTADVAGLYFTGPESFNRARNYAKEVDSKGAPPTADKKKEAPNPMDVNDYAGDARFAEAKRILKEKRITKAIDDSNKSPFSEM